MRKRSVAPTLVMLLAACAAPSGPTDYARTVSAGDRWGVGVSYPVYSSLAECEDAAVDEWDAWQVALTEKVAPVPERILEARTAFYIPTVAATVRQIDQGLPNACQQISYARWTTPNMESSTLSCTPSPAPAAELNC